jgi:cytochrome c biogenesis protein CcdA
MNLILAFLSGLVAAFTPCVIILIPALLYSFFPQETTNLNNENIRGKNENATKIGLKTKKISKIIPVIAFVLSFVFTYSVFAVFLKTLLTSSIKYGLQLGIGILFVVLGILSLIGKFNPLSFPLIKNKWLFGALFAIIISINPCTFAYLGVLLGTTQTASLVLTLVIFSLGLLTPSLLFLFFGKKLLQKVKRLGKITHAMDVGMNILLIAIGAYLMFTIKSFGIFDVHISGALLLVTFVILLRAFYFLHGWNELKNPIHIALFIALIIISLAILLHCRGGVQHNPDTYVSPFSNQTISGNDFGAGSEGQCSANVTTCSICRRCMGWMDN